MHLYSEQLSTDGQTFLIPFESYVLVIKPKLKVGGQNVATPMSSELAWKNCNDHKENYAWPSVDGCSEYKCTKSCKPITYLK